MADDHVVAVLIVSGVKGRVIEDVDLRGVREKYHGELLHQSDRCDKFLYHTIE